MEQEELIKKAQEMYDECGEIDIVKLCALLKIDVYGDDQPFINAKISCKDKKNFEITFNSNHPLTRIRFSIAHELAHFFLHKEEIITEKTLYRSEDNSEKEQEADKLAEEIVMPKKAVQDAMKKYNPEPIYEEVVKTIADKFKVSIIVAAIRLRNLEFKVPYISCVNV